MPGPDQAERERVLELINDEFDKRLAQQAAAGSSIDTKATLILGFVVVAVQIFVGLKHAQPWSALAFVFLVMAFGLGLWTLALRKYTAFPKPGPVLEYYNENSAAGPENLREHVLGRLTGGKADAVLSISTQDEIKAKTWWVMVVAFGLAVAMSVVSVLEAPSDNQRHGLRREHPSSAPSPRSGH